MVHGKSFVAVITLAALTIIGMAATRPTADRPRDDDHKHKSNLKVLPKNISHEDLDKIMDSWKAALGVKCNFCHAQDTATHHLDFASDAKPEKDIARHMFKMTAKINKKYFSMNKDDKGSMIPTVSCVTCHHGNPHPEEK